MKNLFFEKKKLGSLQWGIPFANYLFFFSRGQLFFLDFVDKFTAVKPFRKQNVFKYNFKNPF